MRRLWSINQIRMSFGKFVRKMCSGASSPLFRRRASRGVGGDPTKPGPTHTCSPARRHKMMPHRHVEDRIYTVISGVFYIGLGDTFDENKLTAHAPGTVVVLPAGQAHFHWAAPATTSHRSARSGRWASPTSTQRMILVTTQIRPVK